MNITQHAMMRYCQRMYAEYIINDDTFKTWKRTHEDLVPIAENEILTLFNSADLVIDMFDSKYKINTSENWIFIHDKTNIITCYKLQYKGLPENISKEIVMSLLKVYYEKLPEIKEQESKFEDLNCLIKQENLEIEDEIKLLNQKINNLQEKKRLLNDNIKLKENELKSQKQEFEMLVNKMVKPDYFFK